jgi:hypothetical protein
MPGTRLRQKLRRVRFCVRRSFSEAGHKARHGGAGTIAPQADNFFAAASSLSSTMRCTIAIVS